MHNSGDSYYFGSEDGTVSVIMISENIDVPHDNNQSFNINDLASQVFYEDSMTSELNDTYYQTEDHPTSSTASYSFTVTQKIKHNSPIISICSDGNRLFILDIRGRVAVVPEDTSYDVFGSCMTTKRGYLFVSEKHLLYCKTREAFACWITHERTIKRFCFSGRGAVVFVRCDCFVSVYYEKKIVNRIEISTIGDFVFNEDRNRLIVYDGSLRIIDNVVDEALLEREMGKIVFKETRIEENMKMRNKEDSEYSGNKFVDEGNKRSFSKNSSTNKSIYDKKISINKRSLTDREEYRRNFKIRPGNHLNSSDELATLFKEDKRKYNYDDSEYEDDNYIESDLENEYEKEEETKKKYRGSYVRYEESESSYDDFEYKEPGSKAKNLYSALSGLNQGEDAEMLCYNKTGYIVKHKNIVEVIFHDNNRPKRILNGDFKLGSVSNKGVVLSTKETLFYFGEKDWRLEIKEILSVSITDKLIAVILKNELLIYKHSGFRVYSCLVNKALTICTENETVAVFCKEEILLVEKYYKILKIRFYLRFASGDLKFKFCGVENSKIYYVINNTLYFLQGQGFIKTIPVKNIPLSINNGHLITFNERLLPSPNIEYHKITMPEDIIDLHDTRKEDLISNKIEEAISRNDRNLIEDLYDLLETEECQKRYKQYVEIENDLHSCIYSTFGKIFDYFGEETIESTENIYNSSIDESFKKIDVDERTENTKKTKRFNPFARK